MSRQRFFSGLHAPLHIAHRGGAALAPENTMVAFRQAIERYQTDMLELDVHATRDGELVVAHDATLERCTNGAGSISEHSFTALQSLDAGYHFTPDGERYPFRGQGVRIPRLREVLEAFPGLRFNIELKAATPGIEMAFAKLVRECGAVHSICCGSEDDELAARLYLTLPEACHFYPRDALTSFVLAARGGVEDASHRDERFSVLDMPLYFGGERLFDAALRETCARHGKWVNVWTIDDENEMRALVGEAVGGIMTDRPDVLRRVLSSSDRPN